MQSPVVLSSPDSFPDVLSPIPEYNTLMSAVSSFPTIQVPASPALLPLPVPAAAIPLSPTIIASIPTAAVPSPILLSIPPPPIVPDSKAAEKAAEKKKKRREKKRVYRKRKQEAQKQEQEDRKKVEQSTGGGSIGANSTNCNIVSNITIQFVAPRPP